jgi:transcription-repair coupling factor (superfamily II helicase)
MHAITDINLGCPALLPNNYCPDVHERLSLYKRLSSAQDVEQVEDLKMEIIDRFGDLPNQSITLLENHRLRIQMETLGISKIEANVEMLKIQFIPNPPIDSLKIIKLIQNDKKVQLFGKDRLKVLPSNPQGFIELNQRIEAIKRFIAYLKS